ncbi:hypothetical protein JK636_08970 [Clostridium sp. YIM B02515]|uniref:Uncharacterized protein n=1 Tax=Clostridium rhizosphaerae TaxID=2803861 RepID=A0ABS1T9A4_9CLOT|nr:hypothetical protein [Clostridium rhizosphaerae]MBL4935890.1 hypothetical protein [Clostridium rhizosphaerae]
MKFFNKNKLRIKKEIIKEKVKFYIDYSNLKDKFEFKNKLLTDFINKENCLLIIDSKLQQKGINQEETSDKLEGCLIGSNIIYKKIEDRASDSVSVLGVSVKLDNKNRPKNYIIAFIISDKDLYKVETIIKKYNSHFYIGFINESLEDIIKLYKNDDDFSEKFKYTIFDNNSLESMAVLSEIEDLDRTKDIIEHAAN